jgi:DNA polymerase-3 subunit gamma/tau
METLYRKHRPKKFSDLVGQETVVQILRNAILHDRVVHGYIFSGPRGTGKTTTARLLAMALNCLDPQDADPCGQCEKCLSIMNERTVDYEEIDAASNTGVDSIRDLQDRVSYMPSDLKQRIEYLDEVHRLSPQAFDAFLKLLEEPPENVIFIMSTTAPDKIPDTVLSRSQRLQFRRIDTSDVVRQLQRIADAEGVVVEDDQVLSLIALASEGSMRDAISHLEQLLGFTGFEKIDSASWQQLNASEPSVGLVENFVENAFRSDVNANMKLSEDLWDTSIDSVRFFEQLITLLFDVFHTTRSYEARVDWPNIKRVQELAAMAPLHDIGRIIEAAWRHMQKAQESSSDSMGKRVMQSAAVALAAQRGDMLVPPAGG